jgi:PAS domain S-box-containing protein
MNKTEKLQQLHEKMISEIQDYAIILLDIDGTILTWNKGAEAIKGYKAKEILGQNFRIFYLPRDGKRKLPEKLLELASKEGRARHIGRRVRKDGTTFWGSILITAIHDEEGEGYWLYKTHKRAGRK